MAVTRIQTGLQESGCSLVPQQLKHIPLGIDKVDLPPRLLELIDMRKKGRKHGTGILIQGKDAFRRLPFDAGKHTLAQTSVNFEKMRHALDTKAFLRRLAGLALAQGIFLGQQHPAQHFEANRRLRLFKRCSDTLGIRLIGAQFAHFEKTKVDLKIGGPSAAEELIKRIAAFCHAEKLAQGFNNLFGNIRRIVAISQPLAAPVKRTANQSPRRIEASFAQQPNKSLRKHTLRCLLQARGKRLPQLIEQTRVGFDQHRPG